VEWKKSIIVPIYKKGGKTDCSNYRGIPILSTTYKIVCNILLSKLTPYAEEITGDHQCGFRSNRSTTDHIIYNKPRRCNSDSIVFIINYKYALHVSDALCVHHQEHYKL